MVSRLIVSPCSSSLGYAPLDTVETQMIRLAIMPALLVLAACEPPPVTTSVTASTPPQAAAAAAGSSSEVPREELCATTRDVAERVMLARQLGISEEEVLARVQAVDHSGLQGLAATITRAAYSQPVYAGENAQDRAVADFVRQQDATCQNRLASR